jgi:hypothetical protein
VKQRGLLDDDDAAIYVPIAQPNSIRHIVVRVSGEVAPALPMLRPCGATIGSTRRLRCERSEPVVAERFQKRDAPNQGVRRSKPSRLRRG